MAESLKTLATFATPVEADMARNRLTAEGIQAFVGDDQMGWLWHLGTSLQGVKVLVAESDLPRAQEILGELRRPPSPDEPLPAWPCPKCGSDVDGEMDVCWACGTTREGVEDAQFHDAEAAVVPKPTRQVGPKDPPGPVLAVFVSFCIPMCALYVLGGIDVLVFDASYATSGGFGLLVLAADFLLAVGLFQWFYYQPPSSPGAEAVAAPPQTMTDADLTEEQQQEPSVAHAHALIRRACLAAVLGTAFCPLVLNFYSLWLILRYQLYRPAVHGGRGLLVYAAIAINAAVFLAALMLFLAAGGLGGQ